MMTYSKKIIGIFIFSFISFIHTSQADEKIDCDNTSTTVGMVHCSSLNAKKADLELNQTYKKIVNYLQNSDDDLAKKTLIKLRDAEKTWITFRDQWCSFDAERYPDNGPYTINMNECYAMITNEHNERLKYILDTIGTF